MSDLPKPSFIDRDPQAVIAEMVAQYEAMTGKTLYPAQVDRLLVDLVSYRESLVRIGIQEAAEQNLVAFARAPMLDYLGELLGVFRLPAQPARTTVRLTFMEPAAVAFQLPVGVRVETTGGISSRARGSWTWYQRHVGRVRGGCGRIRQRRQRLPAGPGVRPGR